MDRIPPKRGASTEHDSDLPLNPDRDTRGHAPDEISRIFQRHSAWLRRKLARQYGADRAEDLTQQAFIGATHYAGGTASIEKPQALLLRIARNAAVDGYRRSPRGSAVALDEVLGHPALVWSAEQEQLVLLKQVVLSMPSPLRDVFVLNRFAGMTYLEIARRLGISQKTVEWRMSKALAHCARALGGQ